MHTEDKRAVRKTARTASVFEPRSQCKISLSSSEELNCPLFYEVTSLSYKEKLENIQHESRCSINRILVE